MAKDPAFLFYPNDWLGGTMGMTFEEKGAYMDLLMLQFNRGHMTRRMIGQTIGKLWENIADKFCQDEQGLYYNIRLESEKNKRQNYTLSRRNNREGNNQHTKKESGHTTPRMENENRNKDIIEKRKRKFIEECQKINTEKGTLSVAELKNFCDYWAERGPKDKKMRFEKQTSFDINLRLHRWARNNYGSNKQPTGKVTGTENYDEKL